MQLSTARKLLGWSLLLVPLACNSPLAGELQSSSASRSPDPNFQFDVQEAVNYLASDELEGRGVKTDGINKAADYIASAFDKLGLEPLGTDGGYFQPFQMTVATRPGPGTSLVARVKDGERRELELEESFIPITFSAEGEFEGDAVFVGYGIDNDHLQYNDYEGLDVKGKVAVALRFEPHNEEGKSRFTDGDWSEDATLARKAEVAAKHGAVALVVVNPPLHHDGEGMMPFGQANMATKTPIPLLQLQQDVVNEGLDAGDAGVDLKAIQKKIDQSGKPFKVELKTPIRISGKVEVEREQREVKNVVAMLRGDDAGAADEYVVVGAHYDHLGYGGRGSFLTGGNEIHNGADDNASGTAAMLEIAERYVRRDQRPRRSIIFSAFTAEEHGLIGSAHFVHNPPVPLDKITSMLNLDMVGRVRDDTIYIGGQGTAAGFEQMMKEADESSPLEMKSIGKGGFGPSDHMSFALKKIPVLFLFSGVHQDYHRPTDDPDKVNYDGIEEVVKLATTIVDRLLAMPKEQYISTADAEGIQRTGPGGPRVTLGIVPDYATEDVKGVLISGTTPGTPAAKAGLKDGDVITSFNGAAIETLIGLTEALQKSKPGDKVKVVFHRGEEEIEVEVTLVERK